VRAGRGSTWSTGIEAPNRVGVSTVLDGWGGAADPNVLLNAAITITTAGSRNTDRPMQAGSLSQNHRESKSMRPTMLLAPG